MLEHEGLRQKAIHVSHINIDDCVMLENRFITYLSSDLNIFFYCVCFKHNKLEENVWPIIPEESIQGLLSLMLQNNHKLKLKSN